MKKILILLLVIVIGGAVIWRFNSNLNGLGSGDENATSTESVPASQTIEVSNKLSEYRNAELGFAVKYPTSWEKAESPTSVSLLIPTENPKEPNTVGRAEVKIDVVSGKCAFPPVTTVSERDVVKVGNDSFNMISISNTLQGRNYFNRMYSLQKGSICYFFTLNTIILSPTAEGFVGADAQKVGARNKTIIDTADSQFKDMVLSFKEVTGPEGKDEAQVVPAN